MRNEFLKSWGILVALQLLIAILLFKDFFAGNVYFAYLDIAADTYAQFSAHAMMMARAFASEGWTGWSFQIGLGAPTAALAYDTLMLLTQLGGADHVLELRIWVYVLKLVLAGTCFLLLARCWPVRREAAIMGALAYAFCGYMVTSGVWGPDANPLIAFPLVLWAIVRRLRNGGLVALPLAVAASLYSGIVFLTLDSALGIAALAFIAMSSEPRAMLRKWLTAILPLVLLGHLLAAPYALPQLLQLLDSPRVASVDLVEQLRDSMTPTSLQLLMIQLGGLLHKDIFGSGDFHMGYMNYLEGPDFYIAITFLVLLPQLWRGTPLDRRALTVFVIAAVAYMCLPIFRLAGFGFAAPYFRATTLWLALPLALLGMRAVDIVLSQGVRASLLLAGCVIVVLIAAIPYFGLPGRVSPPHVAKVLVFAAVTALLAGLSAAGVLSRARLAPLLLTLVVLEIFAMAWPSYFALRNFVLPEAQPFKDRTLPALAAIRKLDPGVFRIEKTYTSVHTSDAMAQDYMGVRSYHYHGSAIVDFHQSMDLMKEYPYARPVNFTNWMPDPGMRPLVHSLLGVKYLIADKPLAPPMPGFVPAARAEGFTVYRNDNALPLGFVQRRQVTRQQLAALDKLPREQARWLRDVALMRAVVVDAPLPELGPLLDMDALVTNHPAGVMPDYAQVAQALQRDGLVLSHFSSNRVAGRIHPKEDGILVFSIPAYGGWSLRIDGQSVTTGRFDFGMLGAPVKAGQHQVELTYELPGRQAGLALGAAALAALLYLGWRRRAARSSPSAGV